MKIYLDAGLDLHLPLLCVFGHHRQVASTGVHAQYQNAVQPFVHGEPTAKFMESAVEFVDDPEVADVHWFVKANYTTAFWWYMVNEGLVDNNWRAKCNTYAELDERHNIVYTEHTKRQLNLLDMYPNNAMLVPFYGWDIDTLKVGTPLWPDMDCDMAAKAWTSWLDRYAPHSVKASKHTPAKYTQ